MRCRLPLVILLMIGAALSLSAQSAGKKQEQDREETPLTIIGELGAGHLYLAYLSLGGIADNFAGRNYDAEESRMLIRSVQGLIDNAIEHLQSTQNMAETASPDEIVLGTMVEAYKTLRTEAVLLTEYTKSSSEGDRKKFQDARIQAWEKIKTLLDPKE